MNEILFKVAFVALWIGYVAIRVPHEREHKKANQIKRSNTNVEKVLLIILFIGLLLFPLLWSVTSIFDNWNLNFPAGLRVMGIIIALASLVYFFRIHKALGSNWSPTLEINERHQLIKSGPYERVRHPMFTQIWIWTIAQSLILSNLYAGFSGIITWAIVYFVRIPKEEKMMLEHFGNQYKEYMEQTGKLLPRFKISGTIR